MGSPGAPFPGGTKRNPARKPVSFGFGNSNASQDQPAGTVAFSSDAVPLGDTSHVVINTSNGCRGSNSPNSIRWCPVPVDTLEHRGGVCCVGATHAPASTAANTQVTQPNLICRR